MTSLDTSQAESEIPAGSGRALAETTINMPAPELGRMLANATLAASKEESRPILTCVLLSYSDGRLTATATDSYWLLREALPVNGDGLAFVTLLPAADLAPVVKAAKARTARLGNATITFDGDRMTFKVDTLQVSVTPYPGDFPNVGAIIDGHTPTETSSVAFMSGLIVKAAKVVPGSTVDQTAAGYPIRFTLDGPLKACRAEWYAGPGAELFAIIMPTRVR